MSKSPPPPKPIGNDGTVYRCPVCRTLLPNANVSTFPFCSQRCRLVDLNHWLEGNYQVSRPMDPTDEMEDLPRKRPEMPPGTED